MITVFLSVVFAACGSGRLRTSANPGDSEEGLAVFYADNLHGKKTASGEMYDKNGSTAAHRQLPFGAIVRVTNMENRRYVDVRINDRGPFNSKNRIIDLSRSAAERLDMIRAGVVKVRIEVVSIPEK
jgi:rare lipoprotein A